MNDRSISQYLNQKEKEVIYIWMIDRLYMQPANASTKRKYRPPWAKQ